MPPEVSVIVPTYCRRASLERLLDALCKQTLPPDRFEVVVVDDGSTDGTVEHVLRTPRPYVLQVLQQGHRGPAAARNLGVAQASAPLVLFYDDDVVPEPASIEAHVGTHATEGPGVVVIGPMSPPGDWPRPAWVRWEEEKLRNQYLAMQAGVWSCTERQFYTANSSLSRTLFASAGGFDTTFKRAEDVELGYRLRNVGARFVFNPAADVQHYAARSFAAWRRTPYQYGRYDVIMSRDKGHEALPRALAEFRWRHPLNRAVSRLVTGRSWLTTTAVGLLVLAVRVCSLVGASASASRALSGIFNLLYWQGVCDELGGPGPLWRSIASARKSFN